MTVRPYMYSLVFVAQVSFAGTGPAGNIPTAVFPSGFSSVNAAGNATFDYPTALAIAADGRIFVAVKTGKVFIIQDGRKLSAPFIDLTREVLSIHDQGLMGMALAPDFPRDPFVYLAYSVDANADGIDEYQPTFGRLTRYSIDPSNPNAALPSSRTVLIGTSWQDGVPNPHASHAINCVRFGRDGSLLVSTGDGAAFEWPDAGGNDSAAFADGKISSDQDIGSFRSHWSGSLAGKILRVDPATGEGLPSNPFFKGDSRSREARIWSMGLRNPWRFALRPDTGDRSGPGEIFIAECGWKTWEEVNRSSGGGENFGWPCYEGPVRQDAYAGLRPRHHGCDGSLTTTPPLVAWHHSDATVSLPAGITGSCSIGAVFYTGTSYPEEYRGSCFISDVSDWIKVVRFEGNEVSDVLPFAYGVGTAVDMAAHPVNGDIYFASIYSGEIRRIVYGSGVSEPTASSRIGPSSGAIPLTVHGDATMSRSSNGSPLSFEWDFGNGVTDNSVAASHTYVTAGLHVINLLVRSAGQYPSRSQAVIYAGSNAEGYDVTSGGTARSLRAPSGTSSSSRLPAIHDNFFPPARSLRYYDQFETLDQTDAAIDWIGYEFPRAHLFHAVVFQEGIQTDSGGWFQSVKVQVRSQGIWGDVTGFQSDPAYPSRMWESFETFVFTFEPIEGDAIRIYGEPGGRRKFVTVGELRVIGRNSTPVVSLTASPRQGRRNLAVAFDASASDEDGDNVSLYWNFGDGTESTESRPIHVYTVAGRHIARVLATDSYGGRAADSVEIEVFDNTPPVVSLVSPQDSSYHDVNEYVVFEASGSDPDQPDSTIVISWELFLHHNSHVHPGWYATMERRFIYKMGIPEGGDGTHWYEWIATARDSGSLADTERVVLFPHGFNGVQTFDGTPQSCRLEQNYPNPFNPKTMIRFTTNEAGHATVRIFDLLGREVGTIFDTEAAPGEHTVDWDASGLAGGVYFYALRTESGFVEVKKLMVIR